MPRAKRRKREDVAAATDGNEKASDTGSAVAPPLAAPPSAPQQQPTHILFAESLPSECNEMMLAMLFRQVRAIQNHFLGACFLKLEIILSMHYWMYMHYRSCQDIGSFLSLLCSIFH